MFSGIDLETGLRLGLAGAGSGGGGGLSGNGILVHGPSTSRSRYLGFALPRPRFVFELARNGFFCVAEFEA